MKRTSSIVLFLLFILYACNHRPDKAIKIPEGVNTKSNSARIDGLKKMAQTGDLIFRNGNDEVSRAARSFNRKDTSYSHCGVVLVENDSIWVYHALGGTYNPSQKLMRQSIEAFSDPKENNSIGLYRYNLSADELLKLKEIVYGHHKAGLKFDLFFNFETDKVMYCSEFVFKSLNKATNGRYTSFVRTDAIPFGVTTDDLYLNPESKLIKREVFVY